MNRWFTAVWAVLSLGGMALADDDSAALKPAFDAMTSQGLLKHISTLASDEFEGRGPATKGEEKSVAFIQGEFQKLGLAPGNPDGSFIQKVPLVGFQTRATGAFHEGSKIIEPKFLDDWVAVSRRLTLPDQAREESLKGSEVVFVGYGVVAPEYGWDDYKGADLRGKTLLMLVNDPAVPNPAAPGELDPSVFKGKTMTYYGRWTYKYEIATEKGAAAAIIIHETGPAGYPFEVVKGSWGRENFDIPSKENARRPLAESWIGVELAKSLLSAAGKDLAALKKAAVRRDFKPVPLGITFDCTVKNDVRFVDSKNVVAKIEGADPKLKDEYVIYSAHWDHLGKDPAMAGDGIFNGAVDNASGVASILEIAAGFKALKSKPRRSILFLAVTAEEKGLLGAKYYAENPLYPLEKTAANINIDGINVWGRTADIVDVGMGMSTLGDLLATAAAGQGRKVKPDAEPEKGFFYRSDHFEFAKLGVPALDTDSGTQYLDRPADYGVKKRDEYTSKHYHKVSDEVMPQWDLSGAVEDLRLLLTVGVRVADADALPEWKPGAEFKARREAMLKAGAAK